MPGSSTFRSLKERNAKLFLGGLLASNIGTWLQVTAVVLLVRELGGAGLELGIVLACQFLPMLLLGLWAGGFADRHDRLQVTLVTQTLMGVQAVVLGIIDLSGHESIPLLYAMSGILGLLGAIDNPSRRGLVTELVDPVDIGNAMSLNTSVMTGSRIFGPALAAMLVGVVGTAWCFLLNGVSFLALLGALLAIDRSKLRKTARPPSTGHPVREGLAAVWADPVLRLTLVIFTIVSTFSFNYSVTLPLLIDELGADDKFFGWLLSATSFGSVLGSLVVARRQHVSQRHLYVSLAALAGAGAALALTPNLLVAFAVGLPLGAGGAGFIAVSNIIFQDRINPQMRSRVLALTAVAFLGSTPIGSPITGLIGDTLGARWAQLYGSLIALICIAAAVLILSRRSDHRARTSVTEMPDAAQASREASSRRPIRGWRRRVPGEPQLRHHRTGFSIRGWRRSSR
jgi:MFS family permease